MITPKVLGVFLISIFVILLCGYFLTGFKIVLFSSIMFLLFGGSCFKHMPANSDVLKGKTIFLYHLSTDASKEICSILLDIGAYVICTIDPSDLSSLPLKHKNLEILPLAKVDSSYLDTDIKYIVHNLNMTKRGLHAVIAMPVNKTPYQSRISDLDVNHMADAMMKRVLPMVTITKLLLPIIKKSQGRLVFVGSYFGRQSLPNSYITSMTEHALESFCDSLRRELLFDDVPVSIIETPQTRSGKFVTNVIESLAAPVPKDRYLVGNDIFFDFEKIKLVIYNFLPVSLVDSLIVGHHPSLEDTE